MTNLVRQMEETMYRVATVLLWDDECSAKAIETTILAFARQSSRDEITLIRLLIRWCRKQGSSGEKSCAAGADKALQAWIRQQSRTDRLLLAMQGTLDQSQMAQILRLPLRLVKQKCIRLQNRLENAFGEVVD